MKIGIIGALDEEINLLKKELNTAKECKIAGQNFISGTLKNHDVIILRCGVGKVNAAIGTTLLNHLYHPKFIINVGSAGGISSSLNIGDIIISTEVSYHDVDLTAFGYEFGQASQMPKSYKPDSKLVKMAKNCAKYMKDQKVYIGLVTSGDSFISGYNQVCNIKEKFTEACAAEMEACAIAHVCYLFDTPFLIIRSISDVIYHDNNKKTYEESLPLVAKRLKELVLCILQELK